MRINNNLMAMNTHRQLGMSNTGGAKSMEKLSSGYRINRAGDDAAGLAISEKMRGQIRGLTQASRNSQDGISLIQTAEGALNETHAILQRMRELAVQAASDTNVEADRSEIQKEMNQLTSEINRIGNTTEFNTMKLVNGDRAIVTDDVTTEKTIISDKTYGINSAAGVKGTDGFTGTTVKIAASDDIDWTDLKHDADNEITITRDGDGLKINIKATETGGKTFDSQDVSITANEDGSFSYNAHGVDFKMSKEDFDKMAEGAKVEIDLTKSQALDGTDTSAIGNVGLKNDWTKNEVTAGDLSTATITDGIKIDGKNLIEGAVGVKIEYSDTDDTFTVSILDKDGNALSTDVTTKGTKILDYNNHGLSFKLDAGDAAKLELNLTFDTEVVKETIRGAVISDDSLSFQVGANENQAMSLDIGDVRAAALGISSATGGAGFVATEGVTDGTNNIAEEYALDISSHKSAAASITVLNNAIEKVSSERSKLGAVQNRLEHTIKNLDTSAENLQASESRIRDVDMAAEMMEHTKQNILQQAATAMLAQANQAPQNVLQLLR